MPNAIAITVPFTIMGPVGYSGSFNVGFVGGDFGFWVNGGWNYGMPEVSVGVGVTMGEYKGRGVPTISSYMGYGDAFNVGIGPFSAGHSRGYSDYGDANPLWRSYYGGTGLSITLIHPAIPSVNYSPLNDSWRLPTYSPLFWNN